MSETTNQTSSENNQNKYAFRVESIDFADGSSEVLPQLTIIIGPNNSGKSLALKEALSLTTAPASKSNFVIRAVNFLMPATLQEAVQSVPATVHRHKHGNTCFRTVGPGLNQEHQGHFGTDLDTQATHYASWSFQNQRGYIAGQIGPAHVLYLSTETRISIANENKSSAEDYEESNLLQRFYNLPSKEEGKLQGHVREIFGKDIRLDYSVPQKLCFRVANSIVNIPADPRDARPILATIPKLDDEGDGIRSYVGMVAALISTPRPLILIDEPEAFLHPPQAFAIGKFIASVCNPERRILVSTHNPDLLRGLLFESPDARLIRIERSEPGNKLTRLQKLILQQIVNNPLSGSAQALDGLFAAAVIVVEGYADSRFYQTVLHQSDMYEDIQFVVADNKQTVPTLVSIYRKLGVPSVGIVDIDILSVESELIKACEQTELCQGDIETVVEQRRIIAQEVDARGPGDIIDPLLLVLDKITEQGALLRQAVDSANNESQRGLVDSISRTGRQLIDNAKAWRQIKAQGVSALSSNGLHAFSGIQDMLLKRGLSINPLGELESSLTEFGIPHTTDKRQWFETAMALVPNLEIGTEKELSKFLSRTVASMRQSA